MTAAARHRGLRRLLTEAPRPDAVRNSPRAHWLVVATVCIGAFMGQLDASIVNLAYTDLQRSFHASLGAVEWVALSYLLVLVGLVVAVGRLADMIGRKLLYTYGFVLFTLASAACALAPNLPTLVALRALQAVGAAMLQANSVALIVLAMPREKLGRGIGAQGASQALGLALGPTAGGALVAAGGWRSIFWVNIPAGILGVVLAWLLLPRTRDLAPRRPVDLTGLALVMASTATLLGALSLGASGEVPVPAVAVMVTAAIGFGWLFARHTRQVVRRGGDPLLPPRLFAERAFRMGIGAGLVSYLALYGILFVTPLFLERGLGQSPIRAGLALSALPLTIGLLAPVAGWLVDRNGARLPTAAGLAVIAAGLTVAALGRHSVAELTVGLAVIGVGTGLFTPANNASVMGSAPRSDSGLAGGVLNMTRGIGTASGVAVTGLVFSLAAGAAHTADGASRGFLFACALLVVPTLAAAVGALRRG